MLKSCAENAYEKKYSCPGLYYQTAITNTSVKAAVFVVP